MLKREPDDLLEKRLVVVLAVLSFEVVDDLVMIRQNLEHTLDKRVLEELRIVLSYDVRSLLLHSVFLADFLVALVITLENELEALHEDSFIQDPLQTEQACQVVPGSHPGLNTQELLLAMRS